MPAPAECLVSSFEVKGFKSLFDVQIELGQVNVFVGANGSGKSNLLEAIAILGAAASGRVGESQLRERGVRVGAPDHYLISLWDQARPEALQVGAECSAPVPAQYSADLDPSGSTPWRFTRETWSADGADLLGPNGSLPRDRGLAALRAAEVAPDSPAVQLLNRLEAFRIYSPVTEVLRGNQPDIYPQSPLGLQGGRLASALAEAIRHATWIWLLGLEPGDAVGCGPDDLLTFRDPLMPHPHAHKDFRMGDDLTARESAEGPLYASFLSALLYHEQTPHTWALENFGQALHPRAVSRLLGEFCEAVLSYPGAPKQVLLTTHTPATCDGLDLYDDRIRLFTVARDSKGRTIVRRVDLSDRLDEFRAKDWPLSRLWVEGYLGGVPVV